MSLHRTTIDVVERDEEQWLHITGDLDIEGGGTLRTTMEDCLRAGQNIVIDLSAVKFVDSSGLMALLGAGNDADHADVSLRIFVPPGHQARKLINVISGTGEILRVVPEESTDEA